MKKAILLCSVLAMATTSATAGGLADPIITMSPAAIIEEAPSASSAEGVVIPLILIALVAIASNGGGSGFVPLPPSDSRLKTNIQRVGTSASSLPLYHFSYIGSEMVFEGVMAQDVLTHTPAAVTTMGNGYYAVNYDMLGIEFKLVD